MKAAALMSDRGIACPGPRDWGLTISICENFTDILSSVEECDTPTDSVVLSVQTSEIRSYYPTQGSLETRV